MSNLIICLKNAGRKLYIIESKKRKTLSKSNLKKIRFWTSQGTFQPRLVATGPMRRIQI
jgi:hypothetical protein